MFEAAVTPQSNETEGDLYFGFRGDEMLVLFGDGAPANAADQTVISSTALIPTAGFLASRQITPRHKQYLGSLNGKHCFAAGLDDTVQIPRDMGLKNLRRLHGVLGDELFWIGGRGFQLINWDRTTQFCGRCGHATRSSGRERAKVCPSCGLRNYPRISPAVIVAVTRKNRILLARAYRFPMKIYSVIAGFVEPGETLEQCIHREIKEEVNVEVGNIRYFGSQPWPFPNSLMIAFTAEYAGGKIRIDDEEIMDAGWFEAHELPAIPDRVSIARRLIDSFIRAHT
jgi:NAD+ diphosphatase